MLVATYPTKKDLKQALNHNLRYRETSLFGYEYPTTGTGVVTVVGPSEYQRKWYATVTLHDHSITKVT